ncbi:MAG: hypothetical protein WC125_13190 [Bacteroidales bacterium]
MIVFIQVLIIVALLQINIILVAKVKPIVKDTAEEVKEVVEEVMHPKEDDPEYRKWVQILNNIDSYDGTGKGQIKL